MPLYLLLILLAVLFVLGSAMALKGLDRYAVKRDKGEKKRDQDFEKDK